MTLFFVYILMTSIMLINLLIAIFRFRFLHCAYNHEIKLRNIHPSLPSAALRCGYLYNDDTISQDDLAVYSKST